MEGRHLDITTMPEVELCGGPFDGHVVDVPYGTGEGDHVNFPHLIGNVPRADLGWEVYIFNGNDKAEYKGCHKPNV